jgi:arginine decarboxylase
VTEVLNYVSYNKDDLVARLRKYTEGALRQGRITLDESRNLLRMYEDGLSGYTYLEREVDAKNTSFTNAAQQLRLLPVSPEEAAAQANTPRPPSTTTGT